MIEAKHVADSIGIVLCIISLVDCGGKGEDPVAPTSATPTATATLTGLEPETLYYFAVNAFNGVSGPCSNEVSTVTPPSGAVFLAWDRVSDQRVSAYDVHYGKQSAGQPGDCSYSEVMRVSALP